MYMYMYIRTYVCVLDDVKNFSLINGIGIKSQKSTQAN